MSLPLTIPGLTAVLLICCGLYLALRVGRMPADRPGVSDLPCPDESPVVGMHRLNTAPTVAFKWSLYGFLAFMWFLTVQGTIDGNKRVVPIYILLPASLLTLWWLSGFKRVSLSGDSLIVHERDGDKRIPVDSVKCVSKLALAEGFAHVTIVFKDHAHRRIRVKTFRNDCEHVASLIKRAMREHHR